MSKVSCEGIPSAAPMDINSALEEVLKQSLIADGLARGFREYQKRALDKRQALLCFLAENCDESMSKKMISLLCMEHGIPLIKVDCNIKLGEWAGLGKYDSKGKAKKVVKCNSTVIRSGAVGPAHGVVQEYLKAMK